MQNWHSDVLLPQSTPSPTSAKRPGVPPCFLITTQAGLELDRALAGFALTVLLLSKLQ